ncbi:MAG: LamG-like jellyroll fold domain-containing protein [Bacteroidota bacterium]
MNCGPGAFFTEKNALTVEAWINLVSTTNIQSIVGNLDSVARAGFSMGVQNGQLNCRVFDSTGTYQGFTAGRVSANTWTHIAFSYQRGGRFKGYVNGVMIVNFPATGNPIASTGTTDLIIGAAAWDHNQQMVTGQIDEVRIYNFQRSTAKIREDLRLQISGGAPGLIGYWRFDEGSGTTAHDQSLSGRNGILSGASLPVWLPAEGPYGTGTASLASIQNNLHFPNERLDIRPNTPGINDTFVVSRIQCPPNVHPFGVMNHTYEYWIVDQYDTTAGLDYDLIFKLDSGSIDNSDANNPSNLVLFRRDRFSTASWSAYTNAAFASASDDSVRFTSIRSAGQFIVGTNGSSLLGMNEPDVNYCIYPQPADNRLSIVSDAFFKMDLFTLFDFFGRKFFVPVLSHGYGVCTIDVSEVPNGVYLLQLEGEKCVQPIPMMIIHL